MTGYETLTGTARQLAVTLVADTEDAPGWFRAGVRDVTHDALGALEAVDTARGTLATVGRDTGISDGLKAQRLADALTHAENITRSYVQTAQAGVDGLKAQLDKELTPARPDGITDALLLDMKHDLAAILARETSPDRVQEAAVKLAETAVKEGNGLAFHVLAGGPMHLFYARHGVDRAALGERFADVNPSPAGKLRGRFKGAASVPALVTMSVNAVDMGLTFLRGMYGPAIETLKARAANAPTIVR